MGPIPAELNLDHLVGRELQQVCIGPFDLHLRFDNLTTIHCEGTVTLEKEKEEETILEGGKWIDCSKLSSIVGKVVVSWRKESSHTLSITLSHEAMIRMKSKDSQYEEFTLNPENLIW